MAPIIPKAIDLNALRAQYVKDSLDTTFNPYRIVVHGSSDSGKTVLLCTASKFWHTAKAELDDLIVVDVDGDAAASLVNFGKRVRTVDYLAIKRDLAGGDPYKAMEISLDLATSSDAETIGLDTYSVFTKGLTTYLSRNPKLSENKQGIHDKRIYWDHYSSATGMVSDKLRDSGKNFIVNFHSKATTDDMAKEGTDAKSIDDRKKQVGLPGEPTIMLDTIGDARDLWPKLVSLVVAMRAVVGPKGDITRKVYTRVQEDMQAKSRFNKFLNAVEEPDMSIIINKVRSAVAAQQKKEG